MSESSTYPCFCIPHQECVCGDNPNPSTQQSIENGQRFVEAVREDFRLSGECPSEQDQIKVEILTKIVRKKVLDNRRVILALEYIDIDLETKKLEKEIAELTVLLQ